MNVRRAVPGDELILRSLRLQALADAPENFDSTLERELARSASEWQHWIANGATFVCESDGPKGLVAGIPYDGDPAAILLVSMWVHPTLRGTGAADALVQAVLSWAEAEGAAKVLLHVVQHNARARRCYERNGFRPVREVVLKPGGPVEVEMSWVARTTNQESRSHRGGKTP